MKTFFFFLSTKKVADNSIWLRCTPVRRSIRLSDYDSIFFLFPGFENCSPNFFEKVEEKKKDFESENCIAEKCVKLFLQFAIGWFKIWFSNKGLLEWVRWLARHTPLILTFFLCVFFFIRKCYRYIMHSHFSSCVFS
jgi:hypothetical protein